MDDDISDFLAEQIGRLPELRKSGTASHAPRKPDRLWRPGSGTPVEVEWVRPELADEFPGVRIKAPGRSSRSWSRGRQSRIPSRKAERVLRGASSLEAQHFLDADFDVDVADICEQPMEIKLPDGRRHRPDAFVWMCRPPHEIREVKFEAEAASQEDRWSEIGLGVAALGYGYRVATERRLHHPPREANIELFMSARHAEPPDDSRLDAIWESLGYGSTTVGELRERFPFLLDKQLLALIRLLFVAVADLDQPFGEDTRLVRFRRDIRRVAATFRDAVASQEDGWDARRMIEERSL